MGRFSSQQLEDAFGAYQETAQRATTSGDWATWASVFTDDATYVEHAYGSFQGRDAIRRWITETMGTFPGSHMCEFPVDWHIADPDRGWIVCQIENVMNDPGDGSIHQASNLTVLHYEGDGLWSYEEDVYNPANFMTMLQAWRRRSEELGTLPEPAKAWFTALNM